MNREQQLLTVRIQRYDPTQDEEPHFEPYEVSFEEGHSVLHLLKYIYENLDPTLAYYGSCRLGECAACIVRVNGRSCLACTTLVDQAMAAEPLVIEPPTGRQIIRDLVTHWPDSR